MASASRLLRIAPLVVGIVFAVELSSSVAHALETDHETRTVARELARDGAALADAGKCSEALDLFERAHSLVRAPTIAVMQARCLMQLGRLIEALEIYERVRRHGYDPTEPDAFKRAVAEATTEALDLRVRIPRVLIRVSGPGSSSRALAVRLDDRIVLPALLGVDRPVDPGVHRLEASVPGQARAAQEVLLEESRRYVVDLQLQPIKSTPGSKTQQLDNASSVQPTLGWVFLGIGGAGLATGAVTALLAGDQQSTVDGQCTARQCPESARDDIESFRTLRTVSFISYGVGFAAAATGGVLLLTAPKHERRLPDNAAMKPWIGVGTVGVGGRF
jgi:hypothetical protein